MKTVAQQGLGEIDGSTWIGVLGPAGLPPELRSQLAKALAQAVNDPQMAASAKEMGSMAYAGSPEEFSKVLEAEYKVSSTAVREGRMKAD